MSGDASSYPFKPPGFISTQVVDSSHYYVTLRPDFDDPLSVVCGGRERLQPDYVTDRSDFPYWCIEYVAEGLGTIQLGGVKYALSAGMAFAYGPNMPHVIENDPERPMVKYYVTFVGKTADALLAESPLGNWRPMHLTLNQDIVDTLELMQRDGNSDDGFSARICAGLLQILVLKITKNAVPYGSNELRALQTYHKAARLIRQNFLSLKSVEQAAALCYMDRSHLSRLFQRYSGTTPYRLIMNLKMNRAAELLLKEKLLVKEVAGKLGFTDEFNFSRTFKRIYGVPPEKFRGTDSGEQGRAWKMQRVLRDHIS